MKSINRIKKFHRIDKLKQTNQYLNSDWYELYLYSRHWTPFQILCTHTKPPEK